NYNVVLAIDESGSMHYDIEKAAELAAFLHQGFQEIAIELAVVGYSNVTEMRKKFEEHVSPTVLQERILGNFMGVGTDDFQALKYAYKLVRDREGVSIVI